MRTKIIAILFATLFLSRAFARAEDVEPRLIFVKNKYSASLAALYLPKQPKRVAIVQDEPWQLAGGSSFSDARALAEEGFPVLVVNPRDGSRYGRTPPIIEMILLDIAGGVQEMKDRGYNKIVLLVGSGASPAVAYYQNVAENGNVAFSGEKKIFKFPGFFEKNGTPMRLPKADGLIFTGPTNGTSTTFLSRMDPSIINEATAERDPSLDMYNPVNGFDPNTRSAHYSKDFIEKYGRAQAARLSRLTDIALKRLAAARAGKGSYTDDDFLIIPGVQARLAAADMRVAEDITGKYLILPENVTEVPSNDRAPSANPRENASIGGSDVETCEGFLSRLAIRAEFYNPMATKIKDWGVDVDSSNNTLVGNMRHVSAPWLLFYGTADEYGGEMIYNESKAVDKRIVVLRGATHTFQSVDPKRFASSDDIRKLMRNEMINWIDERFSGSN